MPCGDELFTVTPTLVFSGSALGNSVHSLKSTVQRLTAIERRSNFWSTTVLLDGSYPDLVWVHDIQVYKSSVSSLSAVLQFASDYYSLATLITSSTASLKITDGSTTTLIDFGNCYLDNPVLSEPQDLLLSSAGIFGLQFLGTSIPTVTP